MSEFKGIYIRPELKLFENQKSNVKGLIHKRRCILSDKTGSGKSCSCLYAFAYLKEKGYLKNLFILTPLSAYEKKVWEKDITKFFRFKAIDIETFNKRAEGDPARIEKLLAVYDIVYGKHSSIKQQDFVWLFPELAKIQSLLWIIDEVHELRNRSSLMYKEYKSITSRVRALWGVTATTISRDVENLYNIVNLIYPWYLGSWNQFRDLFCLTSKKTIGYDFVNKRRKQVIEVSGLKDPEGLRKRLEPIFITGSSFLEFKFHYVDYTLSEEEQRLYTKIAEGITIKPSVEDIDWFKWVISSEEKNKPSMGDVDRFSSRFIYLQLAADGIIDSQASYTRKGSVKINRLVSLLNEIIGKGQSALVYFDYLATIESVKEELQKSLRGAVVLVSTGEERLDDNALTEGRVKLTPHVVLCSRASAASVSYYFINNVIFFHNPTIPSIFIQFTGRIRRKNTLFPDDLNCYIFRSPNIDLYKYLVCVEKTVLQEQATGEVENSVPEDYKVLVTKPGFREEVKKTLLWQKTIGKVYETV